MARPRDTELDERIARAVADLLREGGYDAVTVAAVAERAGATRPAVYRRWKTRAELVFDAGSRASVPDPFPDTGSLRTDLYEATRWLVQSMRATDPRAMSEQIGRMIASEKFAREVTDGRLIPDREQVYRIWERAIERAEVRTEVDGRGVIDGLVGAFLYLAIIRHEPLDETAMHAIVDRALYGVLTPLQPGDQHNR